jgi:hypothetical protein
MPLVNIARQQARQGDGNTAFHTPNWPDRAAQQRGTATVHGHRVNLAPLTCGPAHLDGRQIKTMSLLEQGHRREAAAMIDAAIPASGRASRQRRHSAPARDSPRWTWLRASRRQTPRNCTTRSPRSRPPVPTPRGTR